MIKRDQILTRQQMAGRVQRYHTWPVLRPQTVGEHCWRVATIYCEIWGIPEDGYVLYACLHHDSGELLAGDLPYGSKTADIKMVHRALEQEGARDMGVSEIELTDVEKGRLKIADCLECWEYGRTEMMMGNRFAEPVVEAMFAAAMMHAANVSQLMMVTEWIRAQKWEKEENNDTRIIQAGD